jgi:hypothetical protein
MHRRSRPRQWVYSRSVTISTLGHSNGTAHHATTHKPPRCLYPGFRSGHGGERAGWQNAEFQSSPPGCARSQPAQSQRAEYPSAVAGTFAVAGHQRTDVAARLVSAIRSAAAHGRPVGANLGPFRLPIPDGSLALTIGIRPANNATGEPPRYGRGFAQLAFAEADSYRLRIQGLGTRQYGPRLLLAPAPRPASPNSASLRSDGQRPRTAGSLE